MGQAPGFEGLEQRAELGAGGADFLLVIGEAAGFVVRDFVVIFAHVGEDAQEAFAFGRGCAAVGTVGGGEQEREEEAAVLFDVALDEIALGKAGEFGLEIRRSGTARECFPQVTNFVGRQQM